MTRNEKKEGRARTQNALFAAVQSTGTAPKAVAAVESCSFDGVAPFRRQWRAAAGVRSACIARMPPLGRRIGPARSVRPVSPVCRASPARPSKREPWTVPVNAQAAAVGPVLEDVVGNVRRDPGGLRDRLDIDLGVCWGGGRVRDARSGPTVFVGDVARLLAHRAPAHTLAGSNSKRTSSGEPASRAAALVRATSPERARECLHTHTSIVTPQPRRCELACTPTPRRGLGRLRMAARAHRRQ